MRREKVLTLLSGFLLAFLLSFSGVLCVATGFSLSSQGLADLRVLALWCAAISLVFSACYTWRAGLAVPAALVLLALGFWFYGGLELSIEALCNTVSRRYNNAYHWGVVRWSGTELEDVSRTLALAGAASLLAASAAWTVCRRRPVFWALAAGLLSLLPCTMITTTVPAKGALFLWLLAMALLLVTQPIRRRDALQGGSITLYAALPAVLSLVLLFRLVPQEGYSGAQRAEKLLQSVESFFSRTVSNVGGGRDETVKLSRIGRMTEDPTPVMDVTATVSGTYYLRGRAYDIYTGTQWQDSGVDYDFPWPVLERGADMFSTRPRSSVAIRTRNEEDILYLPYYTESMLYQRLGSMQRNTEEVSEYSFDRYLLDRLIHPSFVPGENVVLTNEQVIERLNHLGYNIRLPDESDSQAMTALPEETRLWAQDWAAQIASMYGLSLSDADPDALAAVIGSYLRSCARYDLNTTRMPADQTDFVHWFLTQSDTGYCVHFASSAVVLLRAAGVPARYVSGFLVDAVAGETVTVQQKNAHAWVEYWTLSSGWQILDPTPSATETPPTEPTTEATTEATTVATTEMTTAPTESSSSLEATSTAGESGLSGNETGAAPGKQDSTVLFRILLWVGIAALLAALLIGQSRLRVQLRRRARRRGTPNEQALSCWQQVTLYCRALGEKPDPALRTLAQKAKFSQHELTGEELRQFAHYFDAAISALKKKPLYLRLFHRIILALY